MFVWKEVREVYLLQYYRIISKALVITLSLIEIAEGRCDDSAPTTTCAK
jgi:hypothetical protein